MLTCDLSKGDDCFVSARFSSSSATSETSDVGISPKLLRQTWRPRHLRRQFADQVGALGIAMPGGIKDQFLPLRLVVLAQILAVVPRSHRW